MKTTTFSKIANKNQYCFNIDDTAAAAAAATAAVAAANTVEQSPPQQQYQLQDYLLPSSKSSNCFVNYKLNQNNWHSDSNLYFKYKNENKDLVEDSINDDDNDDDDDDEIDDDELLFSDHAGLFKSLQQNLDENLDSLNQNNTINSIYNDEDFKTKLNHLLSSNEYNKLHYKLIKLSNEQLNNYDLDSINNWSMRFSNEFAYCTGGGQHHLSQQHQQQQQHNLAASGSNRTASQYSSSQTTTSWNKLKNSKSNQYLSTTSATTTSSSFNNESPLIKLYQSKQQSSSKGALTQSSSKGLIAMALGSSSTAAITDDEKRARKKYLSKSPTITFGELKKRNKLVTSSSSNVGSKSIRSCSSSAGEGSSYATSNSSCNNKQSIGTQYPPYLMDQSIQTSILRSDKSNLCSTQLQIDNRYHKVNAGLQTNEADILKEQKKFDVKTNANIKFFYKSLPDLTFLSEYDDSKNKTITDTKKTVITQVTTHVKKNAIDDEQLEVKPTHVGDNEIKLLLLNNSSSSIDKQRRTLKSIKRYRQTKQNTEPCCQVTATIPTQIQTVAQTTTNYSSVRKLRTSESFNNRPTTMTTNNNHPTTQTATTTTTQNNSNSSSSSSSSGYVSADKIANTQTTIATIKTLNRQCDVQQQQQQQPKQLSSPVGAKTPLKSCLKRKDSTSFSSSNSSETQTPAQSLNRIRRYNSTAASSAVAERVRLNSNFKILFENDETNINDDVFNSMPIFIQNIGWLFTCNLKSLKSYSYYKRLNRMATTLAQKYVITIDTSKINIVKEEDDEDMDEDEEGEVSNEKQDEIDNKNENEDEFEEDETSTSPYVRLRHECQIRNARSDNDLRNKKCVSFSECISHHTITPPTSQSSPIHEQQKLTICNFNEITTTRTPLLQYSALIEMLKKSSNTHHKQIKKATSMLVHGTNSMKTAANQDLFMEKVKIIQKQDSIEKLKNQKKLVNKNIYIDVDSISLASLSESPPNEFKFSEDDENENENTNKNIHDLNSHFSNPQQKQLINELKIVIFQLNEIFTKEQELDNEKLSILNTLLKENFCLIIFNLIKDNLKIICNEPIIKLNQNSELKLIELRYEQLCKLFQYLLSIKFIQQHSKPTHSPVKNNNSTDKQQIINNDESSFILNEANSKQKFEAFIYFFLNIKQLSNIFEYINNDKNLLNKFYDLINISSNNSSNLIYLNEHVFNEFIIQLKQLNKYKFKLKYLYVKTNNNKSPQPQSPVTQNYEIQKQQANLFKHSPSPPPPPPPQPAPITVATTIPTTSAPAVPTTLPTKLPAQQQVPNKKINTGINVNTSTNTLKKSPSPPKSLHLHHHHQQQQSSSSVGSHFKNFSKKFNIKSWFTSSSSSSSSTSQSQLKQSLTNKFVNQKQTQYTTINNNNNNNTSLLQESENSSSDVMKHSFSEPMINEFSVNFNPNSSKL